MTAHKHAEMIKAKADNMDLVVFFKHKAEWKKTDGQTVFPTSSSPQVEYFLCHPKHEKECLHWLNGGEVEVLASPRADWDQYPCHKGHPYWSPECVFMDDEIKFRIKPRKEKRWIGVNAETGETTTTFTTKMMAVSMITDEDGLWQIIQIEVEV